jgi:hypothetical protein
MFNVSKQKILQLIVAALAVAGFIATLGPLIDLLPAKWHNYGIGILSAAIALEKVLISFNQILVGPTKLQSASVQDELAQTAPKTNQISPLAQSPVSILEKP